MSRPATLRERYTYGGLRQNDRHDILRGQRVLLLDPSRLSTQEAWQETVDELPVVTNIDDLPEEDRICMVCLEDLKNIDVEHEADAAIFAELPFADKTNAMGGYPLILPCRHMFHTCCIKAHFRSNESCPLCRKEFWKAAREGTTHARREAFERMNLRELRDLATVPAQAPMRCFIRLIMREICNMLHVFAEVHGRVDLFSLDDCSITDILEIINEHICDYRYSLSRPLDAVWRGLRADVQTFVSEVLGPQRHAKTTWAKDIRRLEQIVLQAVRLGLKIALLKQTFIPLVKIKDYEIQGGFKWPGHFDRGGPLGSETVLYDDEYFLEPEGDEDIPVIQEEVSEDDDQDFSGPRYTLMLQQYRGLVARQNANMEVTLSAYEQEVGERLFNELHRFLTELGLDYTREIDGEFPDIEGIDEEIAADEDMESEEDFDLPVIQDEVDEDEGQSLTGRQYTLLRQQHRRLLARRNANPETTSSQHEQEVGQRLFNKLHRFLTELELDYMYDVDGEFPDIEAVVEELAVLAEEIANEETEDRTALFTETSLQYRQLRRREAASPGSLSEDEKATVTRLADELRRLEGEMCMEIPWQELRQVPHHQ
ncbi:uncharacterized protein BDZ99DRAFT_524167 [Mytilinidion resinicola]|uniref:RING-type domain-containing protein n=1 Tax=Mytilinidion resinicola TaxID=574789 RepID=A0A6A6YAS1_9PEZI|nr:uncharacterized protein BDZ99DRAFT_524167 [Mytilinidion resinicola]KAF2805921.1 hypothetical protein BDZ99DRAFT_524167 [Mytilinidion resinicola]